MFSLKTFHAMLATATLATLLMPADASAQQAEFERRAEAMRRARSRQVQPARMQATAEAEAPQRSSSQQRTQRSQSNSRTATRGRSNEAARAKRAPQGYRVAQASTASGLAPGERVAATRSRSRTMAPRVAQNLAPGVIMDGSVMGETIIDGGYVDNSYVDSSYIEGAHYEDSVGCDSCGDAGSYFDGSCGDGSCCGRGGCPPGDCWLSGLGGILRNGDYFFGATAFQSPIFNNPTTNNTDGTNNNHVEDSNFGFYGGVNFGVPLCRLTCGLLSGQVGVRSVQTNFSGNQFTNESRDQLFVTAGVYRRVDYGIQFGIVGDYLQDEFYSEASLAQIRTDLAWVYAGGSTLGFRYTAAQEDDIVSGNFGGTDFTGQQIDTYDQYRFYFRGTTNSGGYGELFAGWTEDNQTILGMDFDVPLSQCVAIESNFTYFFNDDGVQETTGNTNFLGDNLNEAWNLSVGFVYRPCGRADNNSYDRPLFDVADNGTMLIRRANGFVDNN